ncbi:MAG: WYL domain-containing protein [Methylophaga sp.]|nr:WYL domain-containing protein [Methylophaga sp.]
MSRSDETLYRQWVMLTRIPRYPRKITVPDLKNILLGEGYTVDTRTIQRDLNKLSISFPLSNDTEGRKNYWFWIEEAAIQDLPGMDPVTALAFEMAESYLEPLLPQATLELLQPYFHRARVVLNDQSDSLLRKWPDKVAVIERGLVLQKPEINPDVQRIVYQALLEEKPLKASYQPRGAESVKKYLMHPLGIVSRVGVIYLICTLWDYDDVKQFALHRFSHAEIIDDPINIHKNFSLTDYIEQDKEFAYKIEDKSIQLKVLFEAGTAAHLAETPLSENQTLTPQDDGRILLEVEIMRTLELRWWLLGFGNDVEIIKPESMRETFKNIANQQSKIYTAHLE